MSLLLGRQLFCVDRWCSMPGRVGCLGGGVQLLPASEACFLVGTYVMPCLYANRWLQAVEKARAQLSAPGASPQVCLVWDPTSAQLASRRACSSSAGSLDGLWGGKHLRAPIHRPSSSCPSA